MIIKVLLICAVALTLLGVIAVRGMHLRSSILKPVANSSISTAQVLSQQVQPVQVGPTQSIRFLVFDSGIFPSEVKTKPGLANIFIEDKTNRSQGLIIQRVTGEQRVPFGEVRRAPNHWRGRTLLRLLPGNYEVQEVGKPANMSIVVVEP